MVGFETYNAFYFVHTIVPFIGARLPIIQEVTVIRLKCYLSLNNVLYYSTTHRLRFSHIKESKELNLFSENFSF